MATYLQAIKGCRADEVKSKQSAVDWDTFEPIATANVPKTYTPQPVGTLGCLCGIDCSRRSAFCQSSGFLYFKCCTAMHGVRNVQTEKISEPEKLFGKLLSVPAHPRCPETLRGVFWQRDSSSVETMLTFQEADWETARLASKRQIYNWTFVTNWLSYLFNAGRATAHMPINMSPSGKWLFFGDGQYAYRIQPGDEFVSEDGERIEYIKPGDWMRLNWVDEADPAKGVSWQYLVQRVAFLNEEGGLVKTEYYDTLLELAQMESPSWCNLCACTVNKEDIEHLKALHNDPQIFFLPPAPVQMQM